MVIIKVVYVLIVFLIIIVIEFVKLFGMIFKLLENKVNIF